MRYFYIICLVLSSFFIYNQSSADNIMRQYAFFIPGNAYQKNTTVNNLDSMRPRYEKPTISENTDKIPPAQKTTTKSIEKITRPVTKKPLKEIAETKPAPQINAPKTLTVTKQPDSINQEISVITENANATAPTPVADNSSTEQLSEEKLNEIKEKAAQYNIDIDDDFVITPALTNGKNIPKEKTINAMLSEIPYPNPDEPKFKQIFGQYGMALRALYRQKVLPKDREQDKTLAKANSIKRFKVEAAD